MSSAANNVIQFPQGQPKDNTRDNTVIIDADYFGYSETIPITELLKILQKNNTSNTA